MNWRRCFLIIVITTNLSIGLFSGFAQPLTLYPFAEYNTLFVQANFQIANKYRIINYDEYYDGYRVGFGVRLNQSNSYWVAEAGYFSNQSRFTFINLTPDEDPKIAPVWYSLENIYSNRRLDGVIRKGFKLIRHIKGEIGLATAYWIKDELAGKPDEYFEQYESLRRTKVLYRFADSYSSFTTGINAKILYEFGPLWISLSGERNIIPFMKKFELNGTTYPAHQHYFWWSLGVAYAIPIKKTSE